MKFILGGLCLLVSLCVHSQNSYHTVVSINAENQWMRSTAAQVADTDTYIFLYQANGASLSLSGNNTGQVSSLNSAGHYDLNRVIRVNGDTLFLANPINHSYNIARTQLVLFQGSKEVSVTGQQPVSQPFNGITGGVIFVAAKDKIHLEAGAMLNASGAGFRGANGVVAASDCNRLTSANDDVYASGNWRGAPRGEGIAGVPSGQELGRAPAANGGGGGNDHNAGGGGGGNAGAGGIGARNIVMGLLNNACRGNFPGLGGQGLDTNDDRLYLGGGGGAGHANNTNEADGGNGGGLIVLWSPILEFDDGSSLQVNGTPGRDVNGDGGGGGGAGGSILLIADTLQGQPLISLNGGKGGDVTNAPDRCFGPGGGGAGGRILTAASNFTSWSPTLTLEQGGAGLRLNSNECGANEEPAGGGTPGNQQRILYPVPFGGFVQSNDTLCGGDQLLLTDDSRGATGASWKVVPEDQELTVTPIGLSLRVTFSNAANGTYRAIQTLQVGDRIYPGDTAVFTVYPQVMAEGASIEFNDEFVKASVSGAVGYDAIRYDFGDGTVIDTTAISLNHTYSTGGEYIVSITLLSNYCGDIVLTTSRETVGEFAVAEIDEKDAEGCAPLVVSIADVSTGVYEDRRWNFPGGNPETSNEIRPSVTYSEPGDYFISLTLINAIGTDTFRRIPVRVFAQPIANVDFTIDTASVNFRNFSVDATEHYWEFGDSNTSILAEPNHTYAETGTYRVTYVATNEICSDTVTFDVLIDILSDTRTLTALGVQLFPNPTSGIVLLTGPAKITDAFDLLGRKVSIPNAQTLDLSDQPQGVYLVRLMHGSQQYTVRVLRE